MQVLSSHLVSVIYVTKEGERNLDDRRDKFKHKRILSSKSNLTHYSSFIILTL